MIESGLLPSTSYPDRPEPVYWKSATAADCPCQSGELRAAAKHLDGEWLIYSNEVEATDIVSINVSSRTIACREVVLMVRNELTEATALAFLHLMRHLSWEGGSCLSDAYFDTSCDSMNWALIQPGGLVKGTNYRFPRLRAKELRFFDLNRKHLPGIGRFFSHGLELAGLCTFGVEDFLQLLGAVSDGSLCNAGELLKVRRMKMSDEGYVVKLREGQIDSVIDFLRDSRTLEHPERLPSSIAVPVRAGGDWPRSCPRGSGVKCGLYYRKGERGERLEYCFTNGPSRREFRVRLSVGVNSRSAINSLELLF
jgi:hypothetical protein